MTQFQFDLICKILSSGAPALANELCEALDNFVQSYNTVVADNNALKAQVEELTGAKSTEESEN